MSLIPGDINASEGMSKAIYDKLREVLEPIEGVNGEDLEKVRDSWRKLAFAISHGVISHIRSNMEIRDVTTSGNVSTSVDGYTELNTPGGHNHEVDLSGTQNDVIFTQNNDGTGLVD